MAENNALAGKVAVITGAGRGIGRAIAVAYAADGAAVCSRRAPSPRSTRQSSFAVLKAAAPWLCLTDVCDYAAVEAMMAATVQAFGGIDIVVINAGISIDRRTVEESVPDDWQRTLDVNLTGAYNCAKAAIPYLKARGGGKIITMGSGMGHKGRAGSAAYSSKAGCGC